MAWVAERKDVLSGLFFMLTLGSMPATSERPASWGRYLLVLASFALGLTAKPMLVTLPLVLLLLDYWPLGREREAGSREQGEQGIRSSRRAKSRFAIRNSQISNRPSSSFLSPGRRENPLVRPGCRLRRGNIGRPARGHAILGTTNFCRAIAPPRWPMSPTLGKCSTRPIWLSSIPFPRPRRRTGKWLPRSPVGGGFHSRLRGKAEAPLPARRLVLVPWHVGAGDRLGAGRQTSRWPTATRICRRSGYVLRLPGAPRTGRRLALSSLVLGVPLGPADGRVDGIRLGADGVLGDNKILWSHALACTSPNLIAHLNLGIAFSDRGQFDEAIVQYRKVLELKPRYAEAHYNLGLALARRGRTDEALGQFQEALALATARRDTALATSFAPK